MISGGGKGALAECLARQHEVKGRVAAVEEVLRCRECARCVAVCADGGVGKQAEA